MTDLPPSAPTATNDEIYLRVREMEIQAETLYRKASNLASGGALSGPSAKEDRSQLSAISPGARNWDIFEDMGRLQETLLMIEGLLDEALE